MFILAAFRGGRNALLQKIGRLGVTPPILQALTLSSSSIPENSPSDTIVGSIFNLQAGSIATLSDDAGGRFKVVTIAGSRKIAAAAVPTNYEAATSHNITIVETLAGATGNPKSTTLSIAVSNLNDTNPNAFTLNDVTGVVAGSVQTSNAITIAGLGAADSATAAVSGDASSQLQKNGGAWVSGPVSVVNTDTIAVRHTAAASGSTIVNTTLTVGTTTDTFSSTTAAATLDAPVLTKTSGAGVAPFAFTETIPANISAGYGREIQRASDAGFVTIVQDLYDAVTEGQLAGDPDDWSTARRVSDDVLEDLNLAWTNFGAIRMRYFLDLDASTRITSAWSNTISDTLANPVTFSTAVGDHASTLAFSGGNLTLTSGNAGPPELARTTQAKGNKRVFEMTVVTHNGNEVAFGIEDGTTVFGPTTASVPGHASNKGVSFINGSWGWEIKYNSVVLFADYAGASRAIANADVVAFEWTGDDADAVDDNDGQLQVWRRRGGVDTLLTAPAFVQGGSGSAVSGLPWDSVFAFGGVNTNAGTVVSGNFAGPFAKVPTGGMAAFDS